ncbi:hypothetical protein [Streptomyces sp. NPDC006875]|uniref:hypothetical protein n=1 Tax=Streptomyces sp. NPDC006875 TaxID=3154781 RepID=UPI0033E7FE27
MSDHERPQRLRQPGRGGPAPVPGPEPDHGSPAPEPPGGRGAGRVAGLGCLGILGLVVVIGIAGTAGDGGEDGDGPHSPAVHGEAGNRAGSDSRGGSGAGSQAADFTSCVDRNGTAAEKAAVRHVTKVTGADRRSNTLDNPEVFTDFDGGPTGPHQAEGKLIASAFGSCYESDNGLVTVRDRTGGPLADGAF